MLNFNKTRPCFVNVCRRAKTNSRFVFGSKNWYRNIIIRLLICYYQKKKIIFSNFWQLPKLLILRISKKLDLTEKNAFQIWNQWQKLSWKHDILKMPFLLYSVIYKGNLLLWNLHCRQGWPSLRGRPCLQFPIRRRVKKIGSHNFRST